MFFLFNDILVVCSIVANSHPLHTQRSHNVVGTIAGIAGLSKVMEAEERQQQQKKEDTSLIYQEHHLLRTLRWKDGEDRLRSLLYKQN